MPSNKRDKEPEKARDSKISNLPSITAVDGKANSNEDGAPAAAAFAQLNLNGQHAQASSKDLKEEAASSSQSKSVEQMTNPSPTANSTAARQDKARRNDEVDHSSKDESKPRRRVDIGFTPHDFPLSSTDEEAEDPVKEREGRTHRARKVSGLKEATVHDPAPHPSSPPSSQKQLKLHLADSIDASWPLDWSLIFAQARIIEIKWIADDMTTIRSRVRRNRTSWLEEMPHSKWMGEAFQRLQAVKETYGDVEMPKEKGKEGKGVVQHDDQFKAKFLAGFIAKELWETLPERLRAELKEEGIDGPSEVGEFEVVKGLDGEVEVKARRKESG